jgi:hypothetical protein
MRAGEGDRAFRVRHQILHGIRAAAAPAAS